MSVTVEGGTRLDGCREVATNVDRGVFEAKVAVETEDACIIPNELTILIKKN